MINNPQDREEFCRVCKKPINDVPKKYTQYRKYCSKECQKIWRTEYGKNRSKKVSEKIKQENSSFTPIVFVEPEMCADDKKDVLISLNNVPFGCDNTKTSSNTRIGILNKIKKLCIPHEKLSSFKNVEVLKNGILVEERRKYMTINITPVNFFKIVEYHRNLYNETKSYTNLNSYKNAIKHFKVFIEYVNNLKIIEGKKIK